MSKLCPVCGYQLDCPAWSDDLPSFEICPCCGTQFGYDDFCGGDADARRNWWRQARRDWVANGMQWWSDNPPPDRCDAASQVAQITDIRVQTAATRGGDICPSFSQSTPIRPKRVFGQNQEHPPPAPQLASPRDGIPPLPHAQSGRPQPSGAARRKPPASRKRQRPARPVQRAGHGHGLLTQCGPGGTEDRGVDRGIIGGGSEHSGSECRDPRPVEAGGIKHGDDSCRTVDAEPRHKVRR